MAKVYNWQLGREMEYPYEAARPERQFAMVFDTNKCIACQTCTVACKTTWTPGRGQEYMFWNNVETKPYGYRTTGRQPPARRPCRRAPDGGLGAGAHAVAAAAAALGRPLEEFLSPEEVVAVHGVGDPAAILG